MSRMKLNKYWNIYRKNISRISPLCVKSQCKKIIRLIDRISACTWIVVFLCLCLYFVLFSFRMSPVASGKPSTVSVASRLSWLKTITAKWFASFRRMRKAHIRPKPIRLTPIVFEAKYYTEENILLHSLDLYLRAEEILHDYSCRRDYFKDAKSLIICDNVPESVHSRITLLTTMYHEKHKQFIFNNTIQNWAQLRSLNVHPMLYLSEASMLDMSGQLISMACDLGWTVSFVPSCNDFQYPVLKDMLNHARSISPSAWYCFANGDILLASDLVDTLRQLDSFRFQGSFAVARRRNAYIHPNMTQTDVESMVKNNHTLKLHPPTGMDFFAFRETFPFDIIDEVVIGRPLIDNYLVLLSLKSGSSPIDMTETITCIHQAVAGFSLHDNSHLSARIGLAYNNRFLSARHTRQGYVNCIPHYTSKVRFRGFRNFSVVETVDMESSTETTTQVSQAADSDPVVDVLNGTVAYNGTYSRIQIGVRRIDSVCGRIGKMMAFQKMRNRRIYRRLGVI